MIEGVGDAYPSERMIVAVAAHAVVVPKSQLVQLNCPPSRREIAPPLASVSP
jgi:hypothetical protein